jgi:hypothetical protein
MGPPEISLLPSERDVIGPKEEAIPVAEMLRFPEGYKRATKTPGVGHRAGQARVKAR